MKWFWLSLLIYIAPGLYFRIYGYMNKKFPFDWNDDVAENGYLFAFLMHSEESIRFILKFPIVALLFTVIKMTPPKTRK